MAIKKYDSYKDSGVDWIGQVPNSWNIVPIKYVGDIISGYSFKSDDFTESGCRVMKISNIQTMNIDWSDDSYLPMEFMEKYSRFKINHSDLVFALTRPIIATGIKAAIVAEQENILLNQRNAVLKPSSKLEIKWMYYLIFNEAFKSHFESLIDGTGQQPNISSTDISNIKIPLPNKEEQNILTNYLDHKTTKIDDLISKKEQLIELLNEERTTIINQAVTKGLDPNVPMKDSGIEWLGEIPEHWEVKRLKYTCKLISNKSVDKPDYVLALENIESWSGKIIGDPYSNKMEGDVQLFEKGDILFNKLRPYLAKVTLANISGGAMGELLVLRPNEIITSEFLFQRLRSEMIITVVDGSTYGTKMPRASWDKFISHLELGLPSIEEQNEITEYIIETEELNKKLILKTHQEIELLNEYKTALISEVVTGKIDVRDEKLN